MKDRLGLPPPPPRERPPRHGRHPVQVERLGHLAPSCCSIAGGGIGGRPFHDDGLAEDQEVPPRLVLDGDDGAGDVIIVVVDIVIAGATIIAVALPQGRHHHHTCVDREKSSCLCMRTLSRISSPP